MPVQVGVERLEVDRHAVEPTDGGWRRRGCRRPTSGRMPRRRAAHDELEREVGSRLSDARVGLSSSARIACAARSPWRSGNWSTVVRRKNEPSSCPSMPTTDRSSGHPVAEFACRQERADRHLVRCGEDRGGVRSGPSQQLLRGAEPALDREVCGLVELGTRSGCRHPPMPVRIPGAAAWECGSRARTRDSRRCARSRGGRAR